eukprot:Pompholyxophrys_punicea_v1_NODE_515_length_1788_cov_2.610502.p2 type:complete len:218 gc:universal NODE_515_length_1788_cov_2.610502:815-162(-)
MSYNESDLLAVLPLDSVRGRRKKKATVPTAITSITKATTAVLPPARKKRKIVESTMVKRSSESENESEELTVSDAEEIDSTLMNEESDKIVVDVSEESNSDSSNSSNSSDSFDSGSDGENGSDDGEKDDSVFKELHKSIPLFKRMALPPNKLSADLLQQDLLYRVEEGHHPGWFPAKCVGLLKGDTKFNYRLRFNGRETRGLQTGTLDVFLELDRYR